ncbi:MAG: ABC-2 transporter permease [Lawsonibacter sp.]|nr:ABC-2 transporter permease [Lawsonibacter sp.]MCI9027498.1 ABC-2 transporter permease [Lawsonibacter sp.]MCI9656032.1 ABC-2 transporter permease [Lawsonibacter sp.]
MIGLITKDFLVMRKALKSYVLLMGIYIILAYLDFFDYSFIITFIQMVLAVMPISAFAYDEQAKWDRYAMSLPLGRRGVVGARYLFVLGLTLFTVAAGLAGTALLYLVHQADPLEMFVTLMVSTTIGLLIPTILLPLSYKLGAERARPYLYAIIFIPIIAVVLLVKAGVLDMSLLKGMDLLAPTALAGGAVLLPLAGLAALGVSYLISCRIAAGKEY